MVASRAFAPGEAVPSPTRARTLEALITHGGVTGAAELAELMQAPRRTVAGALRWLAANGYAACVVAGRYKAVHEADDERHPKARRARFRRARERVRAVIGDRQRVELAHIVATLADVPVDVVVAALADLEAAGAVTRIGTSYIRART